uniref:Ras-associating domain-containing protein n=2 Tax=Trichobilharzia regenti TaxID=157069 RepID=A0AA85K9Z6_TRIRE|nr:unnamed protein product [Trichobilharzia regenti]
MIALYFLEMMLEVKKAFSNFLRINNDSNQISQTKDSPQTDTQENSNINNHHHPVSAYRNSVCNADGYAKIKDYCPRSSFRGFTVFDSLDLAGHRVQPLVNSKCRPESIELGLISPVKASQKKSSSENGHLFCPVPLEGDTFCDHCSQPIWELGWRPVCLKCAKCHMTCHWLCSDEVVVLCDGDTKYTNQLTEECSFLAEDVSNEEIKQVDKELSELSITLENDENDQLSSEDTLTKSSKVDSLVNIPSLTDVLPVNGDNVEMVEHISGDVAAEVDFPNSKQPMFKAFNVNSSLDTQQFDLNETVHVQQQKVEYVEAVVTATTTTTTSGGDGRGGGDPHTSSSAEKQIRSNLQLSPTLSRRATDLRKEKKPANVKLTTRHSFLSGSNKPPHVCLAYDFSSLDKEAIRNHGISVRQLSPSLTELQQTSSSSHESFHENINITDDFITEPETNVHSSPSSPSPLLSNENSTTEQECSDIGLASVIQTTQEFIRTKRAKRSFQNHMMMSSKNMLSLIPMVVGPRAVLPWSADRLKQLITVFSTNDFGLQVTNSTDIDPCDCEGQVRVHINLLRPIRMLLTARPASIFDVVGSKSVDDEDEDDDSDDEVEQEHEVEGTEESVNPCPWFVKHTSDNRANIDVYHNYSAANVPAFLLSSEKSNDVGQNAAGVRRHRLGRTASRVSTFRLPRGSTKLLHVRLSTTAQMVICALLDRFGIRDNPQKFALYEHTIEGDQKVSVRKLFDDESPLGLLFKWAEQDPSNFNNILSVKRLVLQENETGDIEWSTFSLSELHTFLGILNREENDYRRRIEMKYEIRRKEIKRLMDLRLNEMKSSEIDVSNAPSTTSVEPSKNIISESYNAENNSDNNHNYNNSNDGNTHSPEEHVCRSTKPNVYSPMDSMSAPVSPTMFRKNENQLKLEAC